MAWAGLVRRLELWEEAQLEVPVPPHNLRLAIRL